MKQYGLSSSRCKGRSSSKVYPYNNPLGLLLHYQRLLKYFIKPTFLPAIVLVTLNNMQTISTDKKSGLDYFYKTAFPHKDHQNMQFLLTDPVSPEIIIIQRDKRGKMCLCSQVVLH